MSRHQHSQLLTTKLAYCRGVAEPLCICSTSWDLPLERSGARRSGARRLRGYPIFTQPPRPASKNIRPPPKVRFLLCVHVSFCFFSLMRAFHARRCALCCFSSPRTAVLTVVFEHENTQRLRYVPSRPPSPLSYANAFFFLSVFCLLSWHAETRTASRSLPWFLACSLPAWPGPSACCCTPPCEPRRVLSAGNPWGDKTK